MSQFADDCLVLGFFAAVLIGLILAGCASTPPTQTVDIPVAVSCAIEIDNRPAFPDTHDALSAAENIEARVNLIIAGRLLRDKRIDDLEAALSGCR
jgi:type IV pilus biogenesis protein CpaD/CtpE